MISQLDHFSLFQLYFQKHEVSARLHSVCARLFKETVHTTENANCMLVYPPTHTHTCTEIVDRVVLGEWPCLRPTIDPQSHSPEMGQLMQRCWAEEPTERPEFNHVRLLLHKQNK